MKKLFIVLQSTFICLAMILVGFVFGNGFGFKEGASIVSYLSMKAIIVIVVGILFAGFVQRPLQKYYDRVCTKIPVLIADYALQFVLFFLSVLMLVSGTYNPFIYFQF